MTTETLIGFYVTIPGQLPGQNEIIRTARAHKMAAHQQKKRWERHCLDSILAGTEPDGTTFKVPVRVEFRWFEPHARRDPDNVRAGSKFILDALVKAGVLQNDSRRWVAAIEDSFHTDKANPRVEVAIMPESRREAR